MTEKSLTLDEIISLDKKYYMNTFGDRAPVCFTRGDGVILTDTEGKKYYDFFGGVAVSALGHSHPSIVNAIKTQAEKLIHCSNLYYIESQAKLAELLVKISFADRVFITNSGTEAMEAAIKLAKIYFYKKGMPEKCEFISAFNSFHGRTLAALAATGQGKYNEPFRPIMTGFKHVPLNDAQALSAAIDKDRTCAVILEAVQGESGVRPATTEYIQTVSKLCKELGVLFILDEIQTGLGRTGKLFAYEHFGVEPDIMTLAKALGAGFPVGATLAKEEIASAFSVGDHGSTFAGNPLACSVALASVSAIVENDLAGASREKGEYLLGKLNSLMEKHPGLIKEIRGIGLMIGLQLNVPDAVEIKLELLSAGFIVGSVGNDTLRILPPLIVGFAEIDKLICALEDVFTRRLA
ncbi:MAG: aspartate aminotransferase family protein [Oscillospiraceae bacterium]|nr:aspartate aminotransferase family protein [Oscillospiraceae bacterium]